MSAISSLWTIAISGFNVRLCADLKDEDQPSIATSLEIEKLWCTGIEWWMVMIFQCKHLRIDSFLVPVKRWCCESTLSLKYGVLRFSIVHNVWSFGQCQCQNGCYGDFHISGHSGHGGHDVRSNIKMYAHSTWWWWWWCQVPKYTKHKSPRPSTLATTVYIAPIQYITFFLMIPSEFHCEHIHHIAWSAIIFLWSSMYEEKNRWSQSEKRHSRISSIVTFLEWTQPPFLNSKQIVWASLSFGVIFSSVQT